MRPITSVVDARRAVQRARRLAAGCDSSPDQRPRAPRPLGPSAARRTRCGRASLERRGDGRGTSDRASGGRAETGPAAAGRGADVAARARNLSCSFSLRVHACSWRRTSSSVVKLRTRLLEIVGERREADHLAQLGGRHLGPVSQASLRGLVRASGLFRWPLARPASASLRGLFALLRQHPGLQRIFRALAMPECDRRSASTHDHSRHGNGPHDGVARQQTEWANETPRRPRTWSRTHDARSEDRRVPVAAAIGAQRRTAR